MFDSNTGTISYGLSFQMATLVKILFTITCTPTVKHVSCYNVENTEDEIQPELCLKDPVRTAQ